LIGLLADHFDDLLTFSIGFEAFRRRQRGREESR
jgi:hypothetical protein